MKNIESTIVAPYANIAIAITRFNRFINQSLLNGAIDALTRLGQVKEDNITVVWLPGAYELPLVVKRLAEINKYNAIIALGSVIRGSTPNFNYISSIASSGLAKIALKSNIPIAYGLLTIENIEQAIERCGTKAGNKGTEAALSTLEMINLLQALI
ncbi:MAG: 6,7-dimethyl-8-ribityllumazine synthase [Candidatus Dasytiphilus stammeri]